MPAHTMYMRRVFSKKDVAVIKRRFKRFLKNNPNVKAIIATGISGTIIAPILAFDNNIDFCILRKTSIESSHSGRISEFSANSWDEFVGDFVFVDDLIDGGNTFNKCCDHVNYMGNRVSNIFLYGEFNNSPKVSYQGILVTDINWDKYE